MTQPAQHFAHGPVSRSIRLRPRASAPRLARRLVHDLCGQVGVAERVSEDAAQIVDELVTSSIRQARTQVDVYVLCSEAEVTLRVQDTSTQAPLMGERGQNAARGWDVVRRLSTTWGYCNRDNGRELWASLCANRSVEQLHL
ncbi:MAG: ATP-binding protein [Actinomycetota bacterium]|nr:ATP-binding protein [Actinomycetota bacterium]